MGQGQRRNSVFYFHSALGFLSQGRAWRAFRGSVPTPPACRRGLPPCQDVAAIRKAGRLQQEADLTAGHGVLRYTGLIAVTGRGRGSPPESSFAAGKACWPRLRDAEARLAPPETRNRELLDPS